MDWEQSPTHWSPPAGAKTPSELPGSAELERAFAAFRGTASVAPAGETQHEVTTAESASTSAATAHESDGGARTDSVPKPDARYSWSKPAPPMPDFGMPSAAEFRSDEAPGDDTRRADAESGTAMPPPRIDEDLALPDEASNDADWLAGRRGPAANAYRRLRRLFPR